MADINRVENLRNLVSKDIVFAICKKEGFEYIGEFKAARRGAQAELYIVKKDGVEYILKHYTSLIVGRPGDGYRNSSGNFDVEKYEAEVNKSEDRFKIERYLVTDGRLRKNKHIVDTVAADNISFVDKSKSKLTSYYSIMKKYQPLNLDGDARPNIRSEREALRLGVQVCDALITLHGCKDLYGEIEYSASGRAKGVLHSDIKYENIFCYKDRDCYNYVLADFGMSMLKGSVSSFAERAAGTGYAMAPEMAKFNYSTKVDLYALCATIYLLVNDAEEPMARVGSKGDRPYVCYKGEMPEPRSCSEELQKLLVNGLEYNGKNRKCKSASELKTAFQKIQFNNIAIKDENEFEAEKERIKKELNINDEDAARVVIISIASKLETEDLKPDNIADLDFMEEIGEHLFYLGKFMKKYVEDGFNQGYKLADTYLRKAAYNSNNLKAKYLHGTISNERTAKTMFRGVINAPRYVQKKYPGVKKKAQKALSELEESSRLRKHAGDSRYPSSVHAGSASEDMINQRPARNRIWCWHDMDYAMTDRSIFKLLCMSMLIIATMGACIFVPVFIPKDNIVLISLGATIVVAVLLLLLICVTMKRSIYRAIPANLVVYFLYAQVFCCVITMDEEVIGDLIGDHIWLFGIIVFIGSSVLIFIATAIDVIFLSPYMRYYYLGSFVGLFLGVGITTGGVIEFGVLNFQLLVSDPVYIRGICMAISGLSLLFFKILFYKDFKGYIEDNFKFI